MFINYVFKQIFVLSLAFSFISNVIADTPASASNSSSETPKTTALSSEFIFKYLAAEIAGQRGDLTLAGSLFYELAKSTHDARLAERAAKTALYANSPSMTVESVALWAELDPESTEAQQASMQVLVSTGKLNEAKPYLEKLLQKEDTRANGFLYLTGLFARQSDKAGVLTLVQSLAQPYPNVAESHFCIAHAAWAAKNSSLALNELQLANDYRPGWEVPAILKGQLLAEQSAENALSFYQTFLNQYPKSNEIRLNYARLLLSQKRLNEAKIELITLSKNASDNPEVLVVIGLLSSQANEYTEADKYFQQAIVATNNVKTLEQVYLYLGQNAERQNKDVEALTWYQKINPGDRYLDAKISIATVTSRTQNADAAIALLDKLPDLTNTQLVTVAQAKGIILTREKRHLDAYATLEKVVQSLPNTPEIVYDFAMAAERVNKLDVMEKELRKLILLKPDFAAAYNALGYSLADRNLKLTEAKSLIEKALELNPNDHYILDSMGWIHYRLGDLDKALDFLKRAYVSHNDPEIAAHLSEVLWKQGRQEEAFKILEDAIKNHPGNEILNKTSEKLKH